MDLVAEDEGPTSGAEVAPQMAASGALDEIFSKIDAGELDLTGAEGFIPRLIKAALERGLQAELTDPLGSEKGADEASLFANSRTARPGDDRDQRGRHRAQHTPRPRGQLHSA